MSITRLNKRIVQQGFIFYLISVILMFSCSGVHNEPPKEIIRYSGAGTSPGAGETRSAAGLVDDTETISAEDGEPIPVRDRRTLILDSSGNPIYLD
jgi:hypothetical protein